MNKGWMHMGQTLLKKLIEIGFRRFVQSVEPVKEKTDAGGHNGK